MMNLSRVIANMDHGQAYAVLGYISGAHPEVVEQAVTSILSRDMLKELGIE